MEFYPAKLEWADKDCLLIQDETHVIIEGLPADLCEVQFGRMPSLVTAVITIFARDVPSLRERFSAGQFSSDLNLVIRTMLDYIDKNPPVDSEYCFVCVEP